ncbi:MAG: hypothetical protein AAGK17_09005 [Pseudomonadota bacterium]
MTRRTDNRTERLPIPAGTIPLFTPVPRKGARHDGWTPERQIGFIEALAETGSVQSAAKAVNMSQRGAYHLRRQPGAEDFRKAWQKALDLGVERIEDVAMERALHGVEEPLYSYGKLIGTRKKYNDRLLMFMLRNRAPERFAAGKSNLKGLNAIGKMEKRRLKKKWRKEWEKEQATTSPAEIRASIDRKIEALRREVAIERQREWDTLSDETRAAWDRFASLRDRDLDAMRADEALRLRLERKPQVLINAEPPPRKVTPPKVAKTVHSLKDERWE